MNHCTVKVLSLLGLLFFASSPIRAQTHPCGGGAGNGEVQVGEDPGSNGIAPTPLCDWVKGNQPQAPQPPPRTVDKLLGGNCHGSRKKYPWYSCQHG
jgi:hypothetical protein